MTQESPSGTDILFNVGMERKQEQYIMQPYHTELRTYLSTLHERMSPGGTMHPESHILVQEVEKNTAEFLKSSDIGARFVAMPEFQAVAQKEKRELRGDCAIGLFICIDGRIVPVLVGSSVFDISETKAGLVPVLKSPLDGEVELANPRIVEAISGRPGKESPEILQISAGHGDSAKPDDENCAAVAQMIEQGILPNDGTHKQDFTEMLANTVVAVGATYNRSARAKGAEELQRIGLTARYDTRTAGFSFDGGINTTDLIKEVLISKDLATINRLGQAGIFRNNFTDPATLLARENMVYHSTKVLLKQSKVFQDSIENYIGINMQGFTDKQKQAFRFFIARTMSFQYATGLYQGGETPISSHNEKWIASSTNGLRVGQYATNMQSFGANVANYSDSVNHIKTKVGLADSIGKMPKPYIDFISESLPKRSSDSTIKSANAKLRAHRDEIMKDPDLRARIKAGNLWLIPTVLEEKTGITTSIPNIAI